MKQNYRKLFKVRFCRELHTVLPHYNQKRISTIMIFRMEVQLFLSLPPLALIVTLGVVHSGRPQLTHLSKTKRQVQSYKKVQLGFIDSGTKSNPVSNERVECVSSYLKHPDNILLAMLSCITF